MRNKVCHMDFIQDYPLSTQELLHFPLMFPDALKKYHVPGIPWASIDGLYDYADYWGIQNGTVRTCLSRMKGEGMIVPVELRGITHYRASALQLSIMDNTQFRKKYAKKGFIIAIFSFSKSQEKERTKMRSLLSYAGFVRFAQNSYICGGINDDELKEAIAKEGFSDNVFFFSVPRIEESETTKLVSAWGIPERKKFLDTFFATLREFINASEQNPRDIFCRIGRAWVAYIIHVSASEPPLPESVIPEDYPYTDIYTYLQGLSTKHGKTMYRHWRESNTTRKGT